MLELKNVTKIYKNKVGTDVLALDDISLKFPDKGMVFLLGKSGSGKSTLLNVIGGLDVPSKGEIIVKGRSSKDFTNSDFDSYRNTYVGFVFQEYNVLDEFSTYENIALAIELQDKQVDEKKVKELLDRVDLSGYEKRKPNTLSGGQRQRIAIARALIKDPQIILADEPTGALDSTTGEQVLDTLKKLSNDTLVIVVSHDKDFALKYADRIIELQDGKVINDVSKSEVVISDELLEDKLIIKNGTNLSDSDFEDIKKFILSSGDVELFKNSDNIKLIKSKNDSFDKGFKNTVLEDLDIKEYNPSDTKFIKSKLPFKHAFRIGISSMKNKRFRLFMTVFLVSIAFVLFGLLSTLTFYSSENTFKDTLAKSDYKFLRVRKTYKELYKYFYNGELLDSSTLVYETSFYEDEYKKYREEFGKELFYGVPISINYRTKGSTRYYKTELNFAAYLEDDNPFRDKIVGEYPKNDNEIVVSTFFVDGIIKNTYYNSQDKVEKISSRDEVLGKVISFTDNDYKIVGYFDSGEVSSEYDSLKTKADFMLSNEYDLYIGDGLHTLMFVTKNVLNEFAFRETYYRGEERHIKIKTVDALSYASEDEYQVYSYMEYDENLKDNIVFLNDSKELDDNSTIISKSVLSSLVLSKYKLCTEPTCLEINKLAEQIRYGQYYTEETGLVTLTRQEVIDSINKLINLIDINSFNFMFVKGYEEGEFGTQKTVNIAGIHVGNSSSVYFNSKMTNEYWEEHKLGLDNYSEYSTKYKPIYNSYMTLFVPFDGTEKSIDYFYNIFSNKKYKDDDSRLTLTNYIVENVRTIDMIVKILYSVFLYGGLVLCLFAILLFSNFVNISINHKLREIGILRAVGARGIDVFKIFFAESLFISFMCLAISLTGTLVICNIINEFASYGVGVSILVFGPVSFITLLFMGLLTSFLATYLPVVKAAKKKPVDLIRVI